MKRFFVCAMALTALVAWRSEAQTPVPLITLTELEGRLANGKDTTFVVNLWATWCAPCVAEMPYFEQLQQNHGDKPLRVLFVSLDAKKNHGNVSKFVQEKGFKSEVILLDERNEQEFIPKVSTEWSGAIPATLFVNTEKGVRIFKEREFDYRQLEDSYLAIIQ